MHDQHPSKSYIDLNRTGVALMEIVSRPDMRSAAEAAAYVKKLRSILRYLGTCDGNMEEGSMRADVNVSVRRPGEPFGTRTETKNLNSMRFIQQAIDYEVARQIEIIEDGGEIDQETRLFDTSTGTTRAMRSKEDAHDYRYFPDPDLLPLVIPQEEVDELRAALPELPDQIKDRLTGDYGLSAYDASVIIEERDTAAYYEAASEGRDRKLVANWMTVELFGALNKVGAGACRLQGYAAGPRRARRADRGRHDFRQDRQGRIRRHVRDRQASRRHCRGKGAETGLRQWRHRGHDRRGSGLERGQGCRI